MHTTLEKPLRFDEVTSDQHKATVRLSLTIGQYLQLLRNQKLIDRPTFNRGKVAKPDWKRKIITSIFKGLDLPKFVLWVKDGTLLKKIRAASESGDTTEAFNLLLNDPSQTYPIIDAVQRTTAIGEFSAGKLYTENGLTFFHRERFVDDYGNCTKKGLPENVYDEIFLDYVIDITLFFGSDEEASDYFVALNKGNTMNDQQIRNSFISAVGDFVKETANIIHSFDDVGHPLSTHHPLFDIEIIKQKGRVSDEKLKGKFIKTGVKRMEFDKWLSYCIAYSSWQRDKPTQCAVGGIDGDKLDSMYRNSYKKDFGETNETKGIKNLVLKTCNDIYQMLKGRKYYKQASAGACLNLYMFIDYLRQVSSLRVDDHGKFADWFFKIHNELCKSPPGDDRENDFKLTTRLGYTEKHLNFRLNSIYMKFKDKIQHDKEGNIVPGVYGELGIRILDKNRNITDTEAVDIFHIQAGKDAVTGEDITQADMIKAHIHPHSEGGLSVPENVVLTTKATNRPVIADLELPEDEDEDDD